MPKLWSGRFSKSATKLLDQFNASLMFDKKLYAEDIEGSIVHAFMLAKQNIITHNECEKIVKGLLQIKDEIESDKFIFNIADEDIHMAIEKRLIELIGESGKKLHTARSRNDQVALDFKLYVQRNSKLINKKIVALIRTLHDIAKDHTKTMLPGMTHLQHAQPINFAFYLLAYMSMFKRDYERFQSSIKRNDISPLGCAALAGTPHNIDRFFSSFELGFKEPSINCLDTVSDRDFALEILFNISVMMMHISRFCEELILWSSSEFDFIVFGDEYSTGSSIMPQKKNPDVAELLRGKTGRVNGNLISLLTVLKGLPLAYNKDMQEDKEGVFDSVETALISLEILKESLKTITIKKESMLKACKVGHLSATDLADYLVKELNVSFREAHFITGKVVAKADELKKDLSELTLDELKSVYDRFDSDVLKYLDLTHSMNARDSYGGTSINSTNQQLKYFKRWLDTLK